MSKKFYWRNLTTDGKRGRIHSGLYVVVCHASQVFPRVFLSGFAPLPQYSHGDRYPRTSRFARCCQRACSSRESSRPPLRFSNENNDAVVGLNFEGHRIPHDVNCRRENLPDVIFADLKQVPTSKNAVPVSPKMPSRRWRRLEASVTTRRLVSPVLACLSHRAQLPAHRRYLHTRDVCLCRHQHSQPLMT